MNKSKFNCYGSALISALFLMTLVAIVATAMSSRLQFDIYRTRSVLANDKLYLSSQYVVFWAIDKLKTTPSLKVQDFNGKLLDFPKEDWQIYPDVTLKGKLYDLQSRFNINNLQDPKFHLFFLNLIEKLTKNKEQSKPILDSINYWLSSYQPGRGHDEELNYYLNRSNPYVPGYQLMQSISELRLVKGVHSKLYQRLLPYIMTAPEITAININTASKQVLMALGSGLNNEQVSELLNERSAKGEITLEDLTTILLKFGIPSYQITLESSYFLVEATVTSDDLNMTIYTIINREKDNQGQFSFRIISQVLNTI